ncbi:MAG: PAS domain S-box protein [Chloroflexi bacterium]|nr:PAS domain S-box protein [Chloroflexota bacterium]
MLNVLRRLFTPPIFENEEETRISQFLITFSWIAITVLVLMILSRAVLWTDATFVPLITFGVIILLLLFMQYLIRRGQVYKAGMLVVFGLWGTLTYLAWRADGLRDLAVIAYFIIIILSSLLLERRFALTVTSLSIASIWVFAILEEQGARVLHVDQPISYARDLTGITILIASLIYLLVTGWSRTLQSAKNELQERLRIEEKLKKQAEYLTALHEITLGLVNRLELTPLLEFILSQAGMLLNTPHVGLDLLLPDKSALKQELGYGIFEGYDGVVTFKGVGLTGQVWERGETIVTQDYNTWNGATQEALASGFGAVIGVPLKSSNVVIGTLIIAYTEKQTKITFEQTSLLERFAALASIAIDNARLYEAAQKEIGERISAEVALRASEDKFKKVFNNNNIAISIVTLEDGTFIEANNAFWELSSLTPQEVIGRTSVELNMWDDPQGRKEFVQRLLEKRSLQNIIVEFANKGQPNKSSVAFYELIYIEDQLCILSMFYDITEQKKMQDALKISEARTRAILASIPDMLFEVSKDGTLLDFMASSDLAPVIPPQQFIGKNIKEIVPPHIFEQTLIEQALFALERTLETGQLHAFEYEFPSENEPQFFEARVSAISTESAIIMVRDISQRKWIETEREKLIHELEETNEELERFTYTVSHDLKSPLITIKGFLGFLEQDAASGNVVRLKSDIKRIADATDKMQTLLNDLLELSRIGRLTNPYQQINFESLVREVIELLYGRLHEKEIQVHIQKDLPPVYGDRQRLSEVLQNLLDNAAKFMGTQPKPRIEIGQNGYEGDKAVFFVKDNGLGIDPAHQDRIFGLFNKLDAKTDGTGIGLALVKRIIEIHGGRIWVESEAGRGAAFFFTLPSGPES